MWVSCNLLNKFAELLENGIRHYFYSRLRPTSVEITSCHSPDTLTLSSSLIKLENLVVDLMVDEQV